MTRLAAAVVAVVVLGACGGGSSSGPPAIEYGRDVCDQCHMIISEARYSSAYRDADGEAFVFDDIAEMLAHIGAGTTPADDRVWVHDFLTEEWIAAPAAWYVRGSIETPMGGGIVAFTAEEDAQAFAQEREGDVLRWTDVLTEMSGTGSPPDSGP
jgi:nitrous oxide reductase accessory protein NosL